MRPKDTNTDPPRAPRVPVGALLLGLVILAVVLGLIVWWGRRA